MLSVSLLSNLPLEPFSFHRTLLQIYCLKIHVRVCVRVCVFMCACIHITDACISLCVCACAHARICHVSMRVCMCVRPCVCVSVCVHRCWSLYLSRNKSSAYVTFHVISMFFFKHDLQCSVILRLLTKTTGLFYALYIHGL